MPDFLVSLIPLGVGIALLVRSFSWLVLLLLIVLLGLASAGTGFVRGQLACKYCRQRELGCPAEQLFSRTKHASYQLRPIPAIFSRRKATQPGTWASLKPWSRSGPLNPEACRRER